MCMGRLAVLEPGGGTDPLDTGAVCRDDIDAMEFKDFKALILNIEHETSAVYMQSTRTQEARKRQTPTRNVQPWMSLEDKLSNIEALLQKMELEQEQNSQREYAQTTSATTAKILVNPRYGDDIETCELDALTDSLDYTAFNIEMILVSHQTKKLDIYTYVLEDLRKRISDRIFYARHLTEFVPPILGVLALEFVCEGYLKRSRELTQEAYLDILDIEANYRKDIPSTELEDLRTSLHNIERQTSAVYNDLCTWKTSLARHPAGRTLIRMEDEGKPSDKNPPVLAKDPETLSDIHTQLHEVQDPGKLQDSLGSPPLPAQTTAPVETKHTTLNGSLRPRTDKTGTTSLVSHPPLVHRTQLWMPGRPP